MNRLTEMMCWLTVMVALLNCGIEWPFYVEFAIWLSISFMAGDLALGE